MQQEQVNTRSDSSKENKTSRKIARKEPEKDFIKRAEKAMKLGKKHGKRCLEAALKDYEPWAQNHTKKKK